MSQYFIGIDVSTTASKALAIDVEGNVIVSASHEHGISTPRPLWSEQDPDEWWDATQKSLQQVLAKIPAEQIGAIGLTGQMHGLVVLDAEGKPLRPSILWNDGRSYEQCQTITERIGEKQLYQLIGSIMFPGFTAPKILWLKEHEPEIYAQIKHILLPKDYIRYKLSGAFVTDVAGGSGIALMDVANRTWSPEMLAACGDIPSAWLPELSESQVISAHVSQQAADITGLKAGTPIVGGAGDQPAGGVGNGIVSPGQVSLTIGTSGVAYAMNNQYNPEAEGRLHTFCGPVPNTWFSMGVMLSAAGSMRWFHDEVVPHLSYDELDARAEGVARGADGLLFAPYLSGERHPHPDPLARGAFVGLTVRHKIDHLIRAVMEGVSFGMRDLLELLRMQGIQPTEAVVSGGAVNSPIWRQLTTDIMGIPLYTVNTTEGGAFGAAILATVGGGVFADVPTACGKMVRKVDETTPNQEAVETYNELYAMYKDVYPSLQRNFTALARFEG